jgi:hypothetical protein
MKVKTTLLVIALFATLSPLEAAAHDLFLKMDNFFVNVGQRAQLSIFNGTFQKSEGAVAFARLTDVSVVSPTGKRTHPVESDFSKNETTAFLNLITEELGNYVVGLSTMWRENALKAEEFNKYLPAEGIPDILEARRRDGELGKDARYRYSKYVKAIFQAGDRVTDNYKTILGYAVEMIPQQNPYSLKRNSTLEILCLKDGKPLIGQMVTIGYEVGNKLGPESSIRSDHKGIVRIKLTRSGKWYAKFINMVKVNDPQLDYESKWATLTFQIR